MTENNEPAGTVADPALDTDAANDVLEPGGDLDPVAQRKAAARERLLKAHEGMRLKREAGWKPVMLNPVEKAKANPGSLKMAIKAHCWTCSGAGADPGTRLHVRDCKVLTCCLWPHRPWQTAKGGFVEGEHGQLIVAGSEQGGSADAADDDDADGE